MRIAYVVPDPYPTNSAGTQRVNGIIVALRSAGHEVTVVSPSAPPTENVDRPWSTADEVVFLSESPRHPDSRLGRGWHGLTTGAAAQKRLVEAAPRPNVVILYGTRLSYLMRLRRSCQRLAVPLVVDLVEWYDPAHLPGGRFGPFSVANAAAMRSVGSASGAIVISSFLEEHYRSDDFPVIRVPPLMPDEPGTASGLTGRGGSLTLSYVGFPGRKDAATLRSLWELDRYLGDDISRVKVEVAGITAQGAASLLGIQGPSPAHMHWHGRLDHSAARQLVAGSDFVVLQRPEARYAKAGFPTKIVESLWMGTPVMANNSSDLAAYLVEGFNAASVEDDSPGALARTVRRQLVEKSSFERAAIQEAARRDFASSRFTDVLSAFMEQILGDSRDTSRR
ncbi:glycosyltransferase involved in cell wall biosynthesis [Agromyces sp. 3263]|uniref:glycosyltransferase n=1 Tax=Agromyces sp. 3263 TaxID=2817750 RepID=UPI002861285B|nr:glycosyltransferase [Agromyces sp. 3263]MDR6904805.1 glycosyltransferase involved in cell wall biosynthesis [Agromyces sp. 3263]